MQRQISNKIGKQLKSKKNSQYNLVLNDKDQTENGIELTPAEKIQNIRGVYN